MKTVGIGLSLLVALILAVVAGGLRVQPGERSRVWRDGSSVRQLDARLGWAPRWAGSTCLVEREGDSLELTERLTVTRPEGEFGVAVDLRYRVPDEIPAGWPAGSWCEALVARVERIVGDWLAAEDIGTWEAPEAAQQAAAGELQAALTADGLEIQRLSLRLAIPSTVERLGTQPELVERLRPRRPVLMVGLDGADWELLDDYMARGLMPELERLTREGHGGVLMSLHPPLSPLIWTTAATGVDPLRHEILDFTRFNPVSGRKEPITSDERKAPAIWNMLTWAGLESAVLGLWATYPAEPVRGILVSDRLFTFLYSEASPPPGVVYPAEREAWARGILAASEEAVGFEEVGRFLPWLGLDEYQTYATAADPYAHPISALRRMLVETEVYERLSTEWLAEHRPDFTLVYIQSTDTVGHTFAPYAPPRQPSISVEEYERYRHVPELLFQDIDRLLGKYRELAERMGAVLVLASDHGFKWREGRPESLSSFAMATAAKWHRPEGMYLVWGPGIASVPGHPSRGEVAQLCATLLTLLGMPPGVNLAAPPLPGAPRGAAVEPFDYQARFQPLDFTQLVAGLAADATDQELAKLRALGYLGSDEPTALPERLRGTGQTRSAGSYNNAGLILRRDRRIEEAIAAFEKALEIDPELGSALWNLSDLLFAENRELDRSNDLMIAALAAGSPEGVQHVIGRALGYQRSGEVETSLDLLERGVGAMPDSSELRLFRGRFRVELGDCAGALADFEAAQGMVPGNPAAWSSAGLARLCLGDPAGARADFERSLDLAPDQPKLREYLRQLPLR